MTRPVRGMKAIWRDPRLFIEHLSSGNYKFIFCIMQSFYFG